MSTARQKLEALEKTGKYVFHGSSEWDVEEFEPRQAYDFMDEKDIPDGEPAVFASSAADYAILMAIISVKNCPQGYHSSAGTHDGVLRFSATQETLNQLKDDAIGWVYVFDKSLFEKRNEGSVEYRSLKSVRPLQKIQVMKGDLPRNIEIK